MGVGFSLSGPEPAAEAPVLLHVYNFSTANKALNSFLHALGTGAYHCGVEVNGKEWSYRGAAHVGTGVFSCVPRSCQGHAYFKTIDMGRTSLTPTEVKSLIEQLRSEWHGLDWNLLTLNCCHFCDYFCRCLGLGGIPAWITNLAGTGAALEEKGALLYMKGMEAHNFCCGRRQRGDLYCCRSNGAGYSCVVKPLCCMQQMPETYEEVSTGVESYEALGGCQIKRTSSGRHLLQL